MFSGNGIYLIVLILCVIGGFNLHKLKRKNKKEEKPTEEKHKTIKKSVHDESKMRDSVMEEMRKEVQRQLELAKKENEGEDYEEEIVQHDKD